MVTIVLPVQGTEGTEGTVRTAEAEGTELTGETGERSKNREDVLILKIRVSSPFVLCGSVPPVNSVLFVPSVSSPSVSSSVSYRK
jgi:hypothetical protein